MYRTRKTELLIRASFVAAIVLLAVIVVTGYLSLARGSALAEELIVGASVLALALVLLSILALRRDFLGRTRAEADLDRFFSLSLDFLVIASVDGYFKRVSPAVTDVLGWSPEEFTTRPFMEFVHPDDAVRTLHEVERQVKSGERVLHFENRYRHKDGSWRVLSWRSMPERGLMYATARDVTESFAAASAMRVSHELLEVRVEQRTSELAAANETLRNSETRLSDQLQRLALLSRITRAIGERQDLRSIFQVVVRALEDELPVDFCLVSMYDAAQNQLSVSCVSVKTEPLAQQIGLVQETIIPIDENGLGRCVQGHLVYEPDIAATQFEFPRKLAGAGMRSLVIAPLLVESQVFGVLICARRAPDAFVSGECEFLRQVSEHTALASHQAQLYGALQRAYDDLRQTQQQVMQQERLRALGQMASGIAHDINNAISPMSLYADALLEREPHLTETGRKQLETIQRAVDDVAATVARMGEFYRLREPRAALHPVDLNLLAEHVVDLTRARWSDMAQQRGVVIQMRLDLDPDLRQIAAVESQIRDALVNLVFNAVDAMPGGGPLTIRTRSDGTGRNRVSIEIVDAGVGMDEDTRRRCLEPFFTTKGERGTGLGLAMVYGVAERHGATLEIESQPGKGTTVRLSFAPLMQMPGKTPEEQPVSVGPQRILIIDDDPLLLRSLRDALESDGHEVTAANGGQAGINAFVESHAEGRPFPVVITDLGMPNIDGRKVASTIKAAVPATLVLMLTGWGRRLVAEGDIPPGVDEVLSKPPKLIDLRNALASRMVMRK
ncbi:MAG TPA: ATP-binding protein [Steroidobacteraceae bacterium]|jgi:PAS domain S-box-containing protein|nr:ATP-binding protein [Steroidobacteraceae bacterium]